MTIAPSDTTTSNDSKAVASASTSLHEQVAQWESQLLNDYDNNMSLHDAQGLLMRCVKLSQVLVATVQKKQTEEQDQRDEKPDLKPSSPDQQEDDETMIPAVTNKQEPSALSSSIRVPSEVLRLLIPHLTAKELGRLFLLTSPQIVPMLGQNFVWKQLCLKLWPDCLTSSLGGADWWITANTTTITNNNNNNNKNNAFQWYFGQRQKSILLQENDRLQPLPKPRWNPDFLTLGIDIYNEKGEMVHTRTIDNFLSHVDDFCTNGTVTIHLEEPIPVGSLPTGRGCHCWNLPKSYPGWKARLHVFADNNTAIEGDDDNFDDTSATGRGTTTTTTASTHTTCFNGRQCHTLLDTNFSVWRGFSDNGELTFIQKERTKGLQLKDRGRFLQHRIVTGASKTPNWKNFLGLQAKVILVCEKTHDVVEDNYDSEHGNIPPTVGPIQQFGFTSLRIQVIRLHQNSVGNVQHSLYRKDYGWHTHGVELLHLLEELI
ncbi:unnamed protein product [Cylindrotheca closterium]|uniref:Uncharacterized protein n=1 Tax=Cylindrotheca closterium TaxID=2856 RepID=A0AAD2GD01_9STRA|nr:unnamed protein product [Cylindrotheca closterium]